MCPRRQKLLICYTHVPVLMTGIRISDLELSDEHDTISLEATLVDAANKLLALPRGVLVVLDDTKAKGVLTSVQLLTALASGDDMNGELCGAHMDMDVMEVNLSDELEDLKPELAARKPHAILAVDDAGDFAGYFSPNDYREALQMGD